MAKALYRTNRPKSLDDVIGQDHITTALKAALKSGRLSHAYLFTGPRGVGKTSVARILAHEVNQLKYDDESIHLDIIEIDAASNRRIDEIRDLREKVHITPTSARYKVYIIDEVHMLTREAFNALLKTLEEPPAHCIFILATTEAHKIPETIVSRTQRFIFKPIESSAAASRLAGIAKQEKISINHEALGLLAEHSSGSFRDSIGLLDQLGGLAKPIDAETVRQILGLPAEEAINELLKSVNNGNSKEILEQLGVLKELAINPSDLAKGLSKRIRQDIAYQASSPWQIPLLQRLLGVSASQHSQDSLEIALLEAANRNSLLVSDNSLGASQPTMVNEPSTASKSEPVIPIEAKINPMKKVAKSDPVPKIKSEGFSLDDWPSIVNTVKQEAASLYTALRLAVPNLDDDKLTLSFQFPLHQKKIAAAKSIELIGRLVEQTSGTRLAIEALVDKSLQPRPVTPIIQEVVESTATNPSMQGINDIFGGGEVLES